MHGLIIDLQQDYKKSDVVAVRSGDTVRVTQRVKEASKERLQVFEGLVIRVDRGKSLTARMTVRKLTFGIGVEKSFLLHSPNVVKVEVVKRAKVRRNYLSYMRDRVGKAARLKAVDFDKAAVNEFSSTKTPFELAKQTPAEPVVEEDTTTEVATPVDDQLETPAESTPAENEPETDAVTTEVADEETKSEATPDESVAEADDPAPAEDKSA